MLDLMLITNDFDTVLEAEQAGIDRIFIDLERNGKLERQGHLDTHIGNHSIKDVGRIKSTVVKSKVLVRINPYYEKTQEEVDECINQGADIIMLPMFTSKEEVEKFINCVNGRARTCLLLETSQAMVRIDDILEVNGIDEIHIGLNDLHLCLGVDFMFEVLSGGIVEYIASKVKLKNIKFGFGGIAKIGEGDIPAELIIAEHYRLGSKMVILSRTFRNEINNTDKEKNFKLIEEINKIREYELLMSTWTDKEFNKNKKLVKEKVQKVADKYTSKKNS
ncbi:aldolase/citrate lyase family protein [Tissierella sp.]|uniref:aldolase/citrate lyase family protein n=1 Tax=Tissierella sp. TaxID=41274 RepID=UPI002857DF30|nr:aldolase/citrate lyase family protein [Tissierella sp.]MDR7857550.1 aldolase/citrate lyase family protein [Tissierella sp.]